MVNHEVHEQIIRFSRTKFLLLFSPLLVLMAISLAIDFEQWKHLSGLEEVIIGGSFLFFLAGILILPYRYFLQLSPQGLTVFHVAGKNSYSWDEIVEFRIMSRGFNHVPLGKLIVFDLREDSPHLTAIRRLASPVTKYDVSILATFDTSAEALLEILEEWRRRYSRWVNWAL